MKTTVKVKHIRQSSSKIRFVLKEVSGLKVNFALEKLQYTNKKASTFILKAIKSGISNLSIDSDSIRFNSTRGILILWGEVLRPILYLHGRQNRLISYVK